MIALPRAIRLHDAQRALDDALGELDARLAAAPAQVLDVDLSGVRDYDSSLIALMLGLTRHVAAAGSRVRFTGAPQNLQRLAALYGVDELLLPPRRAEAATP